MPAGTRLLVLLLALPAPVAAQGLLEQFSYEGLRLSGIGLDIGAVFPDRLATEVSGALRVDMGAFAPRIRTMVSVSYFRSRFDQDEIDRFEQRLAGVVNAAGSFSIDVGEVRWTNFAIDLDLQYLFARGGVVPYLGLGMGVHVRNADGAAIDGTFVEDALETIAASLNVTTGLDVELMQGLWITSDVRGMLSSGLIAASVRGGFMYRFGRRS
ncbi:MAG TPA: hypothetical protein VGA37_17495 [Gemmatimonadales bacterium]